MLAAWYTIRHPRERRAAGIAAIVALASALGPPLDIWAGTNLTAHMTQHVILLTIAPLLLVVGDVVPPAAALLRRMAARSPRSCVGRGGWVAVARPRRWHLPAVYDAAVATRLLHAC